MNEPMILDEVVPAPTTALVAPANAARVVPNGTRMGGVWTIVSGNVAYNDVGFSTTDDTWRQGGTPEVKWDSREADQLHLSQSLVTIQCGDTYETVVPIHNRNHPHASHVYFVIVPLDKAWHLLRKEYATNASLFTDPMQTRNLYVQRGPNGTTLTRCVLPMSLYRECLVNPKARKPPPAPKVNTKAPKAPAPVVEVDLEKRLSKEERFLFREARVYVTQTVLPAAAKSSVHGKLGFFQRWRKHCLAPFDVKDANKCKERIEAQVDGWHARGERTRGDDFMLYAMRIWLTTSECGKLYLQQVENEIQSEQSDEMV